MFAIHIKIIEIIKIMFKRKRENKPQQRKKQRTKPTYQPQFNVKTLKDLLDIAWRWNDGSDLSFRLWKLIPHLEELNRLIGLKNLKDSIVDMILYNTQNLGSPDDMMHTAIYGAPGCGKTSFAHILAKIYCDMGCLPTNKVIIAKRSDFIGKYVGHSEPKTMDVLQSSLGGVLFIDEAYSMGQAERPDSFSKAAIDIINQFLSEHKGEMICIIAGYEKEIDQNFFSVNRGLKRRFPWKFKIDKYSGEELFEIFKLKVHKEKWKLQDESEAKKIFVDNLDSFPYSGGDVENFLVMCKTCHSRRIFGDHKALKKVLTKDDYGCGYEKFMFSVEKKDNSSLNNMYL